MARKILNGLDLANQKIVNVADPSASLDVVNLQTLQNFIRGIAAIKEAVRVASTTTINIASPGATIDGVTMVSGDRVLEKDNTTQASRGIYVWNGAAVPMTRANDADTNSELKPGTMVFVTEGTVNGDKAFAVISDVTIVIGTTAQTWSQFGGGTTYTASNGVQLVGSDFRGQVVASGGVLVGASGFSIDTAIVSRKISGSIGNGSLTVIPVTHSFGTKDVVVELRENATDAVVDTDWVSTDVNTVTFTFAVAPTASQYRFTVMG